MMAESSFERGPSRAATFASTLRVRPLSCCAPTLPTTRAYAVDYQFVTARGLRSSQFDSRGCRGGPAVGGRLSFGAIQSRFPTNHQSGDTSGDKHQMSLAIASTCCLPPQAAPRPTASSVSSFLQQT